MVQSTRNRKSHTNGEVSIIQEFHSVWPQQLQLASLGHTLGLSVADTMRRLQLPNRYSSLDIYRYSPRHSHCKNSSKRYKISCFFAIVEHSPLDDVTYPYLTFYGGATDASCRPRTGSWPACRPQPGQTRNIAPGLKPPRKKLLRNQFFSCRLSTSNPAGFGCKDVAAV